MNSNQYQQEKRFYDGWPVNQARDWLFMNPRQRSAVEAALSSRMESEQGTLTLEFGSGIGVCGELYARETRSQVVSLDLSVELLNVGRRLFESENHLYQGGTLEDLTRGYGNEFNQILLVDVLEHIRRPDWLKLFDGFKKLLNPQGQVFISTPTPWYQNYLKNHYPEGLQPVDLSIEKSEIEALAKSVGLRLVKFEVVSIYREGDYQYFWLGSESQSFNRVSLVRDGFLHRHKVLLWKWPRLYVRAIDARALWVLFKEKIRGSRKLILRQSMDVE